MPPFAAYLFDLDGTIYLGDQLLPGARELIEGLRELGLPAEASLGELADAAPGQAASRPASFASASGG